MDTIARPRPAADVAGLAKQLVEQGVKYVFGAYPDLHGVPKSKCVPVEHLGGMAKGSELYTVGGLEGMGELGPHEDECAGIPDLDRLVVLPWDRRYAIAPANLVLHGKPYSHDSRWILQRQLDAARELGYACNVGVEPEVYVLRNVDGEWQPWIDEDVVNLPTRGYDIETTMLADRFLEPMVAYMNELGWDVYSFDHEGGDGQYEFDFRYTDAMDMADRMVLFRLMSKHVARSLGCIATYMPKPIQTSFGSGAHLNVSLFDIARQRNAFERDQSSADGNGTAEMYERVAYHFTAGVLHHGAALTAVLAPTVNSYKRLLPRGLMREISWAPCYRAYGHNNRTLMCRLPVNRHCLEVRVGDSAMNFHLALALVLAAGLDGVRRELDPGDPVNFDTYSRTEEQLEEAGVHRLPHTLGEALNAFATSDLARETLGEEMHTSFLKVKQAEWLEYNTVVGEWERQKYLQLW